VSYPILYNATETDFTHNGLGILGDCASCEVTEEANGIFELAMQYPMDGIHFAEIGDRSIIKAKADQFRDPQLFRVYAISKPMSGIVTVLAEHISYDLSGIPVKPFSAPTASSALSMLKDNVVVDCPFNFWTDKETQANFKVSVPASIRSRLGGVAGSILDVYGGEYEFDNYTVKLHNSRGQNRGVSIRYGKNLTDIKQDQNCSNVATGIYPYWVDIEGSVLVELPEKIVNAHGTYNFVKIRTLDLSSEFETQPTVEQLRSRTESYINANNIGVPVVSWSVSFEQLSKSEEYKHLALLERVSLFDTVNVEFPALGVSATAKAVKMVYDVLADRVKSVTLGSVRANIADTVAKQGKEIGETAKKEAFRAVSGQTSEDVFNRLTDNGRIQGIYIEDGKWYINAELVKIINLIANQVLSEKENSSLTLSGAKFTMFYNGRETVYINNEFGNMAQIGFRVFDESGNLEKAGYFSANQMEVGGPSIDERLYIGVDTESMEPYIVLPNDPENKRYVFWKDNGDGTYSLSGR
jgi:phage minor structural protein